MGLRPPPPPPHHYVLTLAQMEECRYPVPQCGEAGQMVCPPGYVATQSCQGGWVASLSTMPACLFPD